MAALRRHIDPFIVTSLLFIHQLIRVFIARSGCTVKEGQLVNGLTAFTFQTVKYRRRWE